MCSQVVPQLPTVSQMGRLARLLFSRPRNPEQCSSSLKWSNTYHIQLLRGRDLTPKQCLGTATPQQPWLSLFSP